MNLSGIVVTTEPGRTTEVAERLRQLPGVEVHQIDAASHRLVLVQEAPDVGAEVASFSLIRQTAGVVDAGLVTHVFGTDA